MIIDGQNHSEGHVTSSFVVVAEGPFSFQQVLICFSASGWSKTIQISRQRDELGPIEQRY
ncbi:hypothetical protein BYT27DRAFT_7187460 [Phlegmacium glaucopus]|nr:hypothetical protein BYT27DRAFT_7187460 [Phlegmacium glaucopus]